MKQEFFEILTNENIAKDVYRMILKGNAEEITQTGQFVNINQKP